MSRSAKMLLTFEFWLNWTQGVKAKHCRVLSTNFLLSVQYKTDTKQNMVFSLALLNWRKNSNFFMIAVWGSDSMKQNYRGLTFKRPHNFWTKFRNSGSEWHCIYVCTRFERLGSQSRCNFHSFYYRYMKTSRCIKYRK